MDMDKVYALTEQLENKCSFEEISRIYREIIYKKYENLTEYQQIHCYQLLRGTIDIFTQMMNGRVFDEDYLKNAIKW